MRPLADADISQTVPPTWAAMIEAEPRLAFLQDSISAVVDDGDPGGFCANVAWTEFKPQLLKLVGWFGEKEALQSNRHYEVAYHRLYSILPPCRNCGCL